MAGIFVTMGVAGAGKSVIGAAFAHEIGATFVDGDDYHSPENRSRMASGIPLTDALRHDWLAELRERLASAHAADERLVLACSALKRSYRDMLRAGAPSLQLVYLEGTHDVLDARLRHRPGHFMPPSMLDSQLATLEEPAPSESAWVCDINSSPESIVTSLVARVAEVTHAALTRTNDGGPA
jgi:gluconokinase